MQMQRLVFDVLTTESRRGLWAARLSRRDAEAESAAREARSSPDGRADWVCVCEDVAEEAALEPGR